MKTMMELLTEFLAATACPITPPRAYGGFHISFTVVGFVVCFLLARKLRRLSDKSNRILLLTLGILLIVSEVYKQLLLCLVIHPGSYSWGNFPFHLCSIPMYLCVTAAMLKPGRIRNAICTFMMLYNFLGGAISFFEPSGLLHDILPLTIHSCCWHMILVFLGFYLMFSGRGGLTGQDYIDATKVFLLLCTAAFGVNLLFREASQGQLNMFFVGPGESPLIVFDKISQHFGWVVSTAVYIPAVCLGAWLIQLIMKQPFHHSIANKNC